MTYLEMLPIIFRVKVSEATTDELKAITASAMVISNVGDIKKAKDGREFRTLNFVPSKREGMEGIIVDVKPLTRNVFGPLFDKEGKQIQRADALFVDPNLKVDAKILVASVEFTTKPYPIVDPRTGKTNVVDKITVTCTNNENPLAYANAQLKKKGSYVTELKGVPCPAPAWTIAPKAPVATTLNEKDTAPANTETANQQ